MRLKFVATLNDQQNKIKSVLTTVTFWSQIFIILGIAFERYILICFWHRATTLLSKRNKFIFYGIVTSLCVVFPILYYYVELTEENIDYFDDYNYFRPSSSYSMVCFKQILFFSIVLVSTFTIISLLTFSILVRTLKMYSKLTEAFLDRRNSLQ